MRFIYTLLLACFLPLIGLFQVQKTSIDSLKQKVDQLQKSFSNLKYTNDSLNKELYYFRSKEDFYVMAVDRQGSHFEWMVGLGLSLLGLVSLGYLEVRYRLVSKSFAQKVQEIANIIDENEKKMNMAELEHLQLAGDTYFNSSTILSVLNQRLPTTKETLFIGQNFLKLLGIRKYAKAYPLCLEEKDRKLIIARLSIHLEEASNFLSEMTDIHELSKYKTHLSGFFDEDGTKIKDDIVKSIAKIEDEKLHLFYIDFLAKWQKLKKITAAL